MGYDRGDSFPLDFGPNGILFGSKSKGKRYHDHIPFSLKGNGNIVFSVCSDPLFYIGFKISERNIF